MSGVGILAPPGLIRSGSDQTNFSLNGLPPALALEAERVNRRQHLADLLLQQSTQPIQGQMAGRFYVPPNWAQGVAQLGRAAIGGYMSHSNDEALRDLGQRNQDMQQQAILDYIRTRNGVPEQPGTDVQVGQEINLGGMVNTPDGGSAFLNDSGAQPVTAVNPAVRKVAQAQQANYIKGALGPDFAPEGQPNPNYAAALRQNVAGAAQANYPTPVPQAPQNPNMRPVMGSGPNIPAVPGDPKAALVQLLTDPRLPYATAHSVAQVQQHEEILKAQHDFQAQEHQAQRDFLSVQKDEDRQVRRESLDVQTGLRIEQMRQNQTLLQMQIEERQARGQDARDLQKQLADQSAELKREQIKAEDLRSKRHDETMREIGKMNADAKRELAATGKVPPGYRTTPDGNLQAIPGGPADLKLQGALNQDTSMLQSANASMDRLASTANELLNHKGLAGITGLRGAIPNIPGSSAADAQALLDSLKSKVGFNVLQEMRNNSKTGGALGAISDKENVLLQNNLEALDKAQSFEAMQKALKGIVKYSEDAKDRLRNAYNLKHGDKAGTSPTAPSPSGGPQKISSDADYNALPSGSTFIAPDGTTRKKP